MDTVEKIIELIKTDKRISLILFYFTDFPEDTSIWTEPNEENRNYDDIKWLFSANNNYLSLIGVNTKDNTIWCIDSEGGFQKACDCLENLPYEIIRIQCSFSDEETTAAYFKKYDVNEYRNESLRETLSRYEQWCKDNNIELDKNRIYHDKNGKLFEKYFDLEFE